MKLTIQSGINALERLTINPNTIKKPQMIRHRLFLITHKIINMKSKPTRDGLKMANANTAPANSSRFNFKHSNPVRTTPMMKIDGSWVIIAWIEDG